MRSIPIYPVDRIKPRPHARYLIQPLDSRLLRADDLSALAHEFPHASPLEIHRLALLIYGVVLPDSLDRPQRDDGVVAGMDFYIAARAPESGDTPDYDGGRLAVFEAQPDMSPYTFDPETSTIRFEGEVAIPHASQFPRKAYLGPYYLRTNRSGSSNRLVVNPNPNCFSACSWCARTYDLRRTLLREELIRSVLTPEALMELVCSDPAVLQGRRDLGHLEELALMTGDFPRRYPLRAIDYFRELVERARARGFRGTWYYAGNQIETEEEFASLAELGKPGVFEYTIEHFDRRLELMPVKGKRSLDDIERALACAQQYAGVFSSGYYYIVGIDDPEASWAGIERLAPYALPRIHVYTPYAPDHVKLYYRTERLLRLTDTLDLQRRILERYGMPVPSASNRALFTPHVSYRDGVVSF